MLLHVVMMEADADGAADRIAEAVAILETLPGKIAGFAGFRHGVNRDFEGKSQTYPYGFVCTFDDKAALDAYAADPDHMRAGGMLVASCTRGADGIFVVDLDV